MPASPQLSWALKPGVPQGGGNPKANPGKGQAPTDPSKRVSEGPPTDPSTRVSGIGRE